MRISHVLGVDDAPFDRAHRGAVMVVGALYCLGGTGVRLDGVYTTRVRRDGADATRQVAQLVGRIAHVQAVVLQGIALAGFNVIDLAALHRETGVPVLVVARYAPDLTKIRRALETKVPGGARKWRLIAQAGPMERVGAVWVQRAGMTMGDAEALLARWCVQGNLPEPVRAAHLIAGGVVTGVSRGRA